MRAARTAAVAALTACALAPSTAGAAPVCHLVVDRAGDQAHPVSNAVGVQLASEDLDVVGADVASNRRYLTAAVRLASLRETDLDAPTGRWYEVQFTVHGHRYSVRASVGPDGYSAAAWDVGAGARLGGAAAVFDHAKREVRISAPTGTFGILTGMRITSIGVVTGQHYGTNGGRAVPGGWVGGGGGATQESDYATGTRDYVAGSPSCVAVGR